MRFKRVPQMVARPKIDASRALPIIQFSQRAFHIATTITLLGIHLASLLLKAGASK
jgi:hypothetical protein